MKSKEEDRPPIDFKFTPLGGAPASYIKYKPSMPPLGYDQNFDKIDYMITVEQWNEALNSSKSINKDMMDLVEEIFDKLEKFTGKGEVQALERCRDFLRTIPLKAQPKFPTDNQFKAMYNAWIHLRKKTGNALLRMFWKKPDPNDNSPTASFRSRVAEKMQTRRKNKNDQSSYLKLKLLRKEIYAGRQLLGDLMKREKLKMAIVDVSYMELKQTLKEKMDPSYQCPEFKDFCQNEEKIVRAEFPAELAEAYRPEDEEEEKENEARAQSQFDEESVKSSKMGKKVSRSVKESVIDRSSAIGPESSLSELGSNTDHIPKPISQPVPAPITQKPHPVNEKAIVDPTTAMQIAILYNKLHYFSMQVDRSRIKISTHKPIKKEDYLNLPQNEIEKEQYYRAGVRPKSEEEKESDVTTGVKYTIYKARAGRVYILRKAKGGRYQVYDKNSHCGTKRIRPEQSSYLKRFKVSEDEEYDHTRNSYIPVLQNDVNRKFGDFTEPELPDPDEEMADEDTKDDTDDYTEGFIARYRKRKGKKRVANDTTISFKIQS